jgi:hypothetical protein
MGFMQRWTGLSIAVAFLALLAGCASMGGGDIAIRATGAEEVPPVNTSATATGSMNVAEDRTVSGSFKTQGAAITAAHIHEAAAGSNGPVIVPLAKKGDNEWVVPADKKLTAAQYDAFKSGRLYVNFHSAKHKGGEVRAQIRPSGGGGGSGY